MVSKQKKKKTLQIKTSQGVLLKLCVIITFPREGTSSSEYNHTRKINIHSRNQQLQVLPIQEPTMLI